MKVLMITPRYFPYMGGVETHVYEVGRRLASYGIDITLLTTQPHAPYPAQPDNEVVEGIHIIRIPAWPPQRDYYLAPKVIEIIKRGTWDLIHCQGCHTFVPVLAMQAARITHKPYIMTFHTGGHSSYIRTSLRNTQWRLLRSLFARATKLIGVSQFEVNYFRNILHLPVEQFSVVPNGMTAVDMTLEQVHRPERPIIVSPGRLERYKGHHHLIAALPYIQRRYPDVQLLILGQGPYEARLRDLAQKLGVSDAVEIRAIPAAERAQMAIALRQATLVALLSAYESHPIAVLEAITQRRPVLVANTSGLKDLAEQKLVSAIPYTSTPLQIADAISDLLANPYVPSAALNLPDWDDCARQLLDIYQATIRSNVCVF